MSLPLLQNVICNFLLLYKIKSFLEKQMLYITYYCIFHNPKHNEREKVDKVDLLKIKNSSSKITLSSGAKFSMSYIHSKMNLNGIFFLLPAMSKWQESKLPFFLKQLKNWIQYMAQLLLIFEQQTIKESES